MILRLPSRIHVVENATDLFLARNSLLFHLAKEDLEVALQVTE